MSLARQPVQDRGGVVRDMVQRIQVLHNVPAWCVDYLRLLSSVLREYLLVGKAYYAAFFAGRFGPTVLPPEVEVLVPAHEDASSVRAALEEADSSLRFRVIVADSAPGHNHNDEPWWARHLSKAALIVGQGGLCLRNGLPTLYATHRDTARHLEEGLILPSGDSTETSSAEAMRLVSAYPGLKAPFIHLEGKTLYDTFEEIHRIIREGEFGGARKRIELLPAEEKYAEEIRRWHEVTKPTILPLPMPPRANLPSGDPWTAPDAEFREWVLDQTMLEVPRTPKDPWLMQVLYHQRGEQKPSHQGWEVYQHAICSMLVLETDHLPAIYRRPLRVAMAVHDIGKLHNIWTPGCHALIGAKIWHKWRPKWITDWGAELITGLVRTHDMLGLMDRGIMNPEYRGAYSPQEIRDEARALTGDVMEGLKLMSTVYQADIGSVPALRWLLPLTPLLEQIVIAGMES